ncbi:Mdm20 protein [Maudiozyma humilis]|uniref:Mdm20 protein n=1 Tax=Maudiozyma humilis TaxID=51915 RepID=A0AAV5S1V3_MAUHU|nr:Mdm20 protein [Kazachstania humilis]
MSVWEKVQEQALQLIEKSSFKPCYALIEQHKARYPKAAYPQVLEAYTRYRQSPGKFNYEAVLGSTYGAAGKQYAIDRDTLALLHRFFFELGRFDEALGVYERANSRQPSFELSYLWFEQALKDLNFKQMGRAALQLTKFPKDSVLEPREYLFWNAISTVALFRFQKHRVSPQEAQVLPLLTYKGLLGAKPFKSTQEVIVFCTVCEELFPGTKSAEIVAEVLPRLQSSVDLYLKNFFLRHASEDDHQVVFDNCSAMLGSLDDFELMKRVVSSGRALGKVQAELSQLIDDKVGPKSRNARLIRFEMDLEYGAPKVTPDSLHYYLERFHNRPCCAVDIASYRDRIEPSVLEAAFAEFDVPSDLIHDSNALKLAVGSSDTAANYYTKHSKTLKSKPDTDYSQCATFVLDMARETLLSTEPALPQLLYVLSLLENYQRADPHNYETMVWLIALYVHLGLTPLAHSYYADLKVKNVQVDSMDFLLYSRYSTMLPDKSHDYLNRTLPEHNALYDVSLGRIAQFTNIAFDRKSYSKILGMLEFQDKLLKSTGRWGKVCESINLTYVCNDKRAVLLERVRADIARCDATGEFTLSDNRDWSIFGFAKELSKDKLPGTLATLNTDSEWIWLNLAKAFMLEAVPTGTKSALAEKLLAKLPEGCKPEEHLTASELESYNIVLDLYSNNGDNLAALVKNLNTGNSEHGSWRTIHDYLTSLATLKTLDNLKKIKDKELKSLIKQKLSALRDHCDDLFAEYKKQIVAACAALQSGPMHDQLSALGYAPLGPEALTASLLEVQKSVRNL